jgi:hypothetical protein
MWFLAAIFLIALVKAGFSARARLRVAREGLAWKTVEHVGSPYRPAETWSRRGNIPIAVVVATVAGEAAIVLGTLGFVVVGGLSLMVCAWCFGQLHGELYDQDSGIQSTDAISRFVLVGVLAFACESARRTGNATRALLTNDVRALRAIHRARTMVIVNTMSFALFAPFVIYDGQMMVRACIAAHSPIVANVALTTLLALASRRLTHPTSYATAAL